MTEPPPQRVDRKKAARVSPLSAFARASSLHIGGAAVAASLRHDLVKDHHLDPRDVDLAYAVSRVTPGTNQLALFAMLGHRLGGWRLAVQAIAVGTLVPAVIAVLIAFLYTEYNSLVTAFMRGARAGGVAVLLGAAIRLLMPQLDGKAWIGTIFAAAAFLAGWFLPVSLVVLLLLAGASGAAWLRPAS